MLGSSAHGIFQAKILGWVAIFLLQGIFPTQRSNPQSPVSPALQADSLPIETLGSPSYISPRDPGSFCHTVTSFLPCFPCFVV